MLKNLIFASIKHTLLPYNSLTFNFCSPNKSIYKPQLPLTQQYTPIYINQIFSQYKIIKPASIFFYFIPAGLMLINNFMTQWSITNAIIFGLLLIAGPFSSGTSRLAKGRIVHCLQIDPQLTNIYLTVLRSAHSSTLSKDYPITLYQQGEMINQYFPLKQKYPNISIDRNLEVFKAKNKQFVGKEATKVYLQIIRLQIHLIRLKIPISNCDFKLYIKAEKQQQFKKDKQTLSQKQMIEKYGNQPIQLRIKVSSFNFALTKKLDQKNMSFLINPELNANKKYNDYLMALALEYNIDTSDNIKPNQRKKDNENEPKEENKEKKQTEI